jgi:serine/threonine-protein kinase
MERPLVVRFLLGFMARTPVAVGETVDGKYRVERLLGEGGMGVVVLATHLALDQRVAIKFLLPEYGRDPEMMARFAREGRALAKIQSEHVARVMDVGTLASGAPYLVMEYLEGRDLAWVLRTRQVIPPAEAVGWLAQVCEAIAEAHAAGVVHRDLKPANLFLVQRASGRSIVKVLDFGIAKSVAPETFALTTPAAVLGSPLYMAPEQLQASRDVDARADIWALGVILYELTTGRPPFLGDSLPAIVTQILTEAPTPPHVVVPAVPEALGAVAMRCLAKSRDDRYPSVVALGEALAPFAATVVTTVPPKAVVVSELAETVPAIPSSAPPQAPSEPAPSLEERTGRDNGWGHTQAKGGPARSRRVVAGVALVIGAALGFVALTRSARPPEGSLPPSSALSLSIPTHADAPAATLGSATLEVDAARVMPSTNPVPVPPASTSTGLPATGLH